MSIEKTLTIEFYEDENLDATIGCLEDILNDHESVRTYDWEKKTEDAPATKTAGEFFSALANLCSQSRVSVTGDLGDEITVNFRGEIFIARWDRNNKVFKFWPEGEEEKEEKKTESSETVIREVRIDPCPENAEYVFENSCRNQTATGWVCTRKHGHSGPHHAHTSSISCHCVWED